MNDLTKFNTIVGVIESDILSAVSDIVLNPPAINLYDTLKQRLIKQFSDTDNKKLKSLLNNFQPGDMRPSDLLRKIRELSCNKVGDDLLRTLWLQRLPLQIQTVLSTSNDNLDQLSAMADTMFDVTDGNVFAVTKQPDSQSAILLTSCANSKTRLKVSTKTFMRLGRAVHENHQVVKKRTLMRRVLLTWIFAITINTLVAKQLNAKTPTPVNLRDS